MEQYIVRIKEIQKITHDVICIQTDKPPGYNFSPGQATELAVRKPGWEQEKRPFTFTSLPSDPYLEFIIKIYATHEGVTEQLSKLVPGDELIIHEVWGAIAYKGQGLFVAGGAGITPFIAIFRQLHKENKFHESRLLIANKRKEDIILETELKNLLGEEMISILSEESIKGHRNGFVTKQVLEETIPPGCNHFYVCGPPPMMDHVIQVLEELGIEEKSVTIEI